MLGMRPVLILMVTLLVQLVLLGTILITLVGLLERMIMPRIIMPNW